MYYLYHVKKLLKMYNESDQFMKQIEYYIYEFWK